MSENRGKPSDYLIATAAAKRQQSSSDRGLSRRGFFGQAVAAAILPALLNATRAAKAAPAGLAGKPLVIAMKEGALRTLDPNNAYEPEWMVFGKALYSQLVTIHGASLDKVSADYANSWDISTDGLTYVFNLNPKATFSDGTPLTPDDLVFSFERFIRLKGPGSWLLDGIKTIEKTGPNQIKIIFEQVNVDFLAILTTPSLNIAKASEIKAHGGSNAENAAQTDTARSWLDQHSIGSGPFVLERWTHGADLVLRRNQNYWGTPAPVDSVIFKFVNNENIQRDLLLRGDAHIAVNLSPDLAQSLKSKNSNNVDVLEVPALAPAYLGWSAQLNPVLRNPKIWDAIKYAIDYDGLAGLYLGGGQFTGSCVPPSLGGALPAAKRMRQDIEKAKATLAAAGHPGGFSMNVTFASDIAYTTVPSSFVVQKVAADLQQIGIQLNLNPVLFSQMLTDYRAGKLEAVFHWWSSDYAGWTDYLPIYAPGGVAGKKRHHWDVDASPEAKQIAELTSKAMRTPDLSAQYTLTQQAQELLNQHGPYAWLFETNYQIGVRKDFIKSLPINPVWYFDLAGMELT